MLRSCSSSARPRLFRSFATAAHCKPQPFRPTAAASTALPSIFPQSATAACLLVPNQALSRAMSTGPRAALPNMGAEVTAGDDDFEAILTAAGNAPVVVDFYANWCGPCRMIAPALKKVVKENGKTFLVKVDVDQAEDTAAKYQISSLPTVAIFRNGAIVDKFLGTRSEADIRQFIQKATNAAA
ncbi:thioredoxin 2 [Geranomyces michiganensis]|nr:thioredoxin 2 [Geranomyces michiganensis]